MAGGFTVPGIPSNPVEAVGDATGGLGGCRVPEGGGPGGPGGLNGPGGISGGLNDCGGGPGGRMGPGGGLGGPVIPSGPVGAIKPSTNCYKYTQMNKSKA